MPESGPPPPRSAPIQTAAEKKAREQKWLEENREAIEVYNKYIEENGLPFAEFRPL